MSFLILISLEHFGSSGDELDSPKKFLPSELDVPSGLQVIPLNSTEYYMDRIKIRSTEHLLTEMAKLHEPQPSELDIKIGSVFTKILLPRGTRYGPFSVKWTNEPVDRQFAWEVIAGSSSRGWLEPIPESAHWLKHIRTVYSNAEANIQNFLIAGYVWYEIIRDIPAGTEIVAAPKVPLQLRDIFNNGPQDDRSDRETGSQHSGTGEDDFNTGNELDNNKNHDSDKDIVDSNDEEAIDFKCVVCDRQCQDIDQLDDHLIASHHYPKEAYHCEICTKSYCYRPSLLRHRALVHGELRKYPCENCTKVFTDPSNLQRHIRSYHVGARSHACLECGKTFATSSGLKQHTHIHSSVKPFQCEVCFKAYTQFSNLCRHKRMHADCRMQIKCTKCGQSFSTVTSLSKHKRFCDSTGNTSGVSISGRSNPNSVGSSLHHHHHQQHHSPATLPPAGPTQLPQTTMTTPPNPFLMFRGPSPFLPTGFGPYHGLHAMFPDTALQSPHPFPLLFPQHSLDIGLDRERNTSPLSSRLIQANNCTKVSPPTAEEASSHLRPSPARPIAINLQHSLSNKNTTNSHISSPASTRYSTDIRKSTISSEANKSAFICVEDYSVKKERNDRLETLLKRETTFISKNDLKRTHSSIEIMDQKASELNGKLEKLFEQPLDLSLNRNKMRATISISPLPEISPPINRTHSPPVNLMGHTSSTIKIGTPIQSPQAIHPVLTEPLKAESPHSYQASPSISVSPVSTPSPSPPTSGPALSYPRPIHPMLLDAIYRPTGLSGFQRPFPFLGPIGRPGFEILSRHGPFPTKPFHEALMAAGGLPPGLGGKLKDRYTCKFCGKVFPRSANLTRHLRTHTGEQPYKCKYCERSFSISSNLQRHVRNIHNKERPFKCHLCERCFGQQTNLDRHLKKHEADVNGLGFSIGDSPSSNEADREENYFDDIRSFIGKVTYSGNLYTPLGVGTVEADTEEGSDVDNEIIIDKEPLNNNESIEIST